LKACGVVTGAAAKGNRFVSETFLRWSHMLEIQQLVRPMVLAVASAQLVRQVLQLRRQARKIRTQVLPQPLAYGVADRSAGLVIELFPDVANSTVHEVFRSCPFQTRVLQDQVAGLEIVSRRRPIECISGKHGMKVARRFHRPKKAPARRGAGAFTGLSVQISSND
jgi:hypothetical protein